MPGKEEARGGEPEDWMDKASRLLDDHLYGPRYASQTGAYENAVSSAIVDYKKVKKLDGKLRPIKVFSAVGGALCLYNGLRMFASGNVKALLYFAIGYDLFTVSYNCFIKRYCSNAGRRFFKEVNETVVSAIKETLGLKNTEEDPIAMLNRDLDWDSITKDTLTRPLVKKIADTYFSEGTARL